MNRPSSNNEMIPSHVYKSDCLQAIFDTVNKGYCVRVLGPRFRSKGALMLAATQMLQEHGAHAVHYLSMKQLANQREESFMVRLSTDLLLISEADVYVGLFTWLQQELFPMDTPIHAELMQTPREFLAGMQTLIRRLDRPLVLFIDTLNAAPPNVVISLLDTLADLFTAVSHRGTPQFLAVIGGTLHLEKNSNTPTSRFLQLSELVWIRDLDSQEQQAFGLAACYRAQVTPDSHALQTLYNRTGGDLFLIERILGVCLKQLARRGQKKLTAPRVSEAIETFLNNPLNSKIEEIFRLVDSDPNLLHCAMTILEHGSIPIAQIPLPIHDFPNLLDLCGIFQREGNSYKIKGDIWGQLLQKHLNPAQVGGFYALNGRWQQAFEYLGRALNQGQNQVRPALFTAVLNAMHASQNAKGAFNNLALGLTAAFPSSDLHLYAQQEGKLALFYPNASHLTKQIALDPLHQPEIQALNNADYTILPVNGEIRLLIPLHTELKSGDPIGLVSLGNLVSQRSPYQRRDEVMQLVGFLEQAAQVIEERANYANLLDMAEMRVTRLNRLNGMLTQMLHHREWSEPQILQAALVGITSPHGLDLNRAVLFMLNENEQCLQVPYAAGQLTQQDAEIERQIWLQQPEEATLMETAVSHMTISPLQNALKRLRLPLYAPAPDLLLHLLKNGQSLFSSQALPKKGLHPAFCAAINAPAEFALVPLTTGEQTFGILYVDNKFGQQAISQEQYQLLQTFVNQVALVVENARALIVERQRTSSWRHLLNIEEKLNNQVTQSLPELLKLAASSAKELFQADSLVIYPFQPAERAGVFRYEPAYVTAVGLQKSVQPSDKPRSSQGMAALVLQDGYVPVSDVQTAASSKVRRCIDTSTFLSREGIRAFVGVRLGSLSAPTGLLYLNWMHPHQLTSEQKTVLEVFANFIAIALPSARSYQQVQHNLSRRNLELKSLDQVFSNVYFGADADVDNTILLALRHAKRHTHASRVFLIQDEPKGRWGVHQLLSTGRMHSATVDALPRGLIEKAYIQAKSQLETNAGRPETGRFRSRFYSESRSGLAVPVKVTDNALAVLYLESRKRDGLTKKHQVFLEKLASRLAINLEQADRDRAMRKLRNLSQQLANEANLERLLAAIISQALHAMQATDAVAVYHQNPETEEYMVTAVSSDQETPITSPLPGPPLPIVQSAWQQASGEFVANINDTPQLRNAFPNKNMYQSAAVFPLEIGQTRVGCILFGYKFQSRFSQAEMSMLDLFAQLAALAILRAQLHTEAEQRQERLITVSRITPLISASVSTELVFRNLMQEILGAFSKANNVCIVEHLPEKNQVAVTSNTQSFYNVDLPLIEEDTFRTRLDVRRGVAGRVFETGQLSNVPDVSKDSDYIRAVPSTKSEIAVPLVFDGVIKYVLVVESDQKAAFTGDDEELLTTLANHAALAVKNAEQFKRAQALELTKQTAMMATGLIHDINNAVATFPDLVDEISYNYANNRDISAPLRNLEKSAKVTDKISGRLKDFVFTGAYKPNFVDVNSLILNALELSLPQKPPHITIEKVLASELPKVPADSLWIELLIKNLLVNAFAAIPIERDDAKVIIAATNDDTYLFLRIRDNGRGIGKDVQRDIFKFGISTKEDADHKMHGVGLFHSQLIAQAHNGTLTLESESGVGSVFTLSLPLQSNTQHTTQEGLVNV